MQHIVQLNFNLVQKLCSSALLSLLMTILGKIQQVTLSSLISD